MAKAQNKQAELEYYKQYAQNLVGEGDDFPPAVYSLLFDQFDAKNGKGLRLLDAGCGSGIYGKRLSERGYQVIGVDLCQEMVEIANTRNPATGFQAIQGDLEDKSLFPENHFDVIFFGQMLHHFPHIAKVIESTYYWLKPGGVMMILEPNGSSPINMISKVIGRFFAFNKEMKKSIGTENERSLGHKEILNYVQAHQMSVVMKTSLDFRLMVSKDDPMPAFLRFMVNCREILYGVVAKILPEMYRGRIMLIKAQKV